MSAIRSRKSPANPAQASSNTEWLAAEAPSL